MRKFLRYADVIVLFSGALGLFLRLMLRMAGTDERGLYPANHPAWIILCIFSLLMVGFLWLLTRDVGTETRYRPNLPASIPGAIGCVFGAMGLAMAAFSSFDDQLLHLLCSAFGILGAAALAISAVFRFTGRKPHFLCHALPAGFFVLRIFVMGQALGSEPEIHRFLFEMLASLAVIPACYQMWGFDVDQGRREKYLFWVLTAAYLSMVAIVGMENWLVYLCMSVWLITNLCTLQYLPKQAEEEEEPRAEPEEIVTEELPQETATDPLNDFDPDKILAEILKDIDTPTE